MIVYFDTNIFDHLDQLLYGIKPWDVYCLEKAVKDEKIKIILSYLNIEETLPIVESRPDRAKSRIYLMLHLADLAAYKQLYIKSQEMILGDDIRHYAHGATISSPLQDLAPSTELVIRNMAQPSGPYLNALREIVGEVRTDKEQFRSFLEDARARVLKKMKDKKAVKYKFERFWENNCAWLAEGLAARAGVLEECRSKGVKGLLDIKSVRLAVGASLSLIHSHVFESVAPKPGDNRDIIHAVLASTAQIFVSHDGDFSNALRRIPNRNIEVMDVHELARLVS